MLLTVLKKPFSSIKPGLAVGILLSLGVGILFYIVTARTIEKDNEQRFENMARSAQYNIDERIKSYTDVLRASASLFGTNEEITREQFQRFVAGLQLPQHYPAIEAMNYVRWLEDADRDAFENKVRREDAQTNDGRPEFKIRPLGRRPNYSVVMYIEPDSFWRDEVGLDLNAQPLIYQAIAFSRDTGILGTTGSPIKAMLARKRIGLGMRYPVYRANAPLNSVEARRAAYVGSVGIAFNVERLVQGVRGEMPIKSVRLTLFNGISSFPSPTASGPQQLLYDSDATDAPSGQKPRADDRDRFLVSLPIQFNGRQWVAHFSAPKRELYRSSDKSFHWLAMLAGFTSTMLLYGLYYTLTSSRKRAIELAQGMTKELRDSQTQLIQSHESLRRLTAHAENIKESERKRIAREIHDDLGQNLLALRIDAQLLFSRTRGTHPRLHARAATTLGQIDATIKSVRQLINDLRPNVLDLGLNAAVDWQISEFSRRTGVACQLVDDHTDIVVSDHCATALFRILQESLTNVTRHAHAARVQVDLRMENGWVRMSVSDDGIGLLPDHQRRAGSFGLIGIEERVRILGGTFAITSAPGCGTTVQVSIPAQQEETNLAMDAMPSVVTRPETDMVN